MKKKCMLQLLALVLVLFSACSKEETPKIKVGDLSLVNEEINLHEWQVIGPFAIRNDSFKTDNEAIQFDYMTDFGQKENQLTLSSIKSQVLRKRQSTTLDNHFVNMVHRSATEYVNFNDVFRVNEYLGNCYAFCNVESAIEQDVAILVGCDDGIKIWVNNQFVIQKVERSGSKRNNIVSRVHLKKGSNLIVVKVLNLKGNWSFYFNLASLQYEHQLYLCKVTGNFLSKCMTDSTILNMMIYKSFFKHVDMIDATIKDVKGKNLITTQLPFNKDSFEIHHQGLKINRPYIVCLGLGEDTISQMFFYGDTSKFLAECRDIAANCKEVKLTNNLNTLFYRYNFLRSFGNRNGFDLYLNRKITYVLYELGQITENLKNKQEPFKAISGLHLRSYCSTIDNQVQDYQLYIPENYNKNKPIPLVVEMPWLSETQRPFLESWHIADLNWLNAICRIADKYGFAYLWPNSRTYNRLNFNPVATEATFEAINAVKKDYFIDTTRLYLFGACGGGANALVMASRFPDKFAAVAVEGPALSDLPNNALSQEPYEWLNANSPYNYAENFIQLPTYIVHSTIDEKASFENTSKLVDKIKEANGNIRFEAPKICKNATMDYYPGEQYLEKFFQFFVSKKRITSPDKIVFTTWGNKYNYADGWLKIKQLATNRKALLKASVEKNTIHVTTSNITALSVQPSNIRTLNKSKKLKIYVNDTLVFDNLFGNNPIDIGNLNYNSQKNCFTEGPINHFFSSSFIIVKGTLGNTSENKYIGNCTDSINRMWNHDFYTKNKVVDDYKISNEDLCNKNLLLVGNETTNAILKRIYKNLPVHSNTDRIEVGNKKFKGNDLGVVYIYPNPFNKQKYILVVAASNLKVLNSTLSHFWYEGFYDYYIINANTKNIVGNGYFDNYWK